MQIEYINVNELIPYVNNAKKHPDEQVNKIASSIKNFGFRQPIVIDNQNEIIAGHGRLEGAKRLGMEQVPCVRADDLSQVQVRGFRLADNRVAESDWDWDLVAIEIEELQGLDFDVGLTGFDPGEIEEQVGAFDVGDGEMPEMSNDEKAPIQQMTFTLHDEQVEVVKEALQKAKDAGPFVDTGNENSNGNALARIAEAYRG